MTATAVCVVCGDKSLDDSLEKMPWEKEGKGEKGAAIGSEESVYNQVVVMLLVRKILGISEGVLEGILVKYGNPTGWGLRMCGECNRMFKNVAGVHNRIMELMEEFEGLVKNMRVRVDRRGTSEVGQRKVRGTKRMRWMVETSCDNSHSGRTALECIREACMNILEETATEQEVNPTGAEVKKTRSTIGNSKIVAKLTPEEARIVHRNGLGLGVFCRVKIKPKGSQDPTKQGILKIQKQSEILENPTESTENKDSKVGVDDKTQEASRELEKQTMDETNGMSTWDGDDSPLNDMDTYDNQDSCGGGDMDIEDLLTNTASNVDENCAEDVELNKSKSKRMRIDVFSVEQPVKTEDGYKCPICPRRALIKSSIHGHILRAHHNDPCPFHCHLCEKQFKREVLLRTHLEMYHNGAKTPLDDEEDHETVILPLETDPEADGVNNIQFECDICPKLKHRVRYKSEETLEAHKKLVHQGIKKPYECKICRKTFKFGIVLRQHMYVHRRKEKEKKKVEVTVKPKPKYCVECDKHFKTHSIYLIHLTTRRHNGQNPFQCEFCSKGFWQKSSLENHYAQEHYAEKNIEPFKCSFCSRILSSKRALDQHTRTKHTKDTDYKCTPCNLYFATETVYRKHLAIVHEKDRPLLCTYCPKRFNCKNHLETHLRTHTGEKPFKCETCGKEYSDRPTYRRHLETHGDKIHECPVCQKQFKVWHSYRIHLIKTHKRAVKRREEVEGQQSSATPVVLPDVVQGDLKFQTKNPTEEPRPEPKDTVIINSEISS